MDIQQMRYFLQIYEDMSITKASNKLFISQQGLSRIIRGIEKEYQIQLFERSPRGLKSTLNGKIMYQHCKKVVKDFDEMIRQLSYENYDKHLIRVGVTSLLNSDKLVESILEFHDKFPDIKLEFISLGYYDCERYLDNNLIDLCLTIKPDDIVKFKFISIWRDRFLLYTHVDNPLRTKKHIVMSDLENEEFVMLSRETKGGSIIREYIRKIGFYPKILISTSQMNLAFEYVCKKKAIAILPEYVIPKTYRRRPEIYSVPVDDLSCCFEMGILYHKNKKLSQEEKELITYTQLTLIQNGRE